MVVRKFYKQREDGVNLYITYSDTDHYIRKVGTQQVYSEAVDIEGANYSYEEIDKLIEKNEDNKEQNEQLNND